MLGWYIRLYVCMHVDLVVIVTIPIRSRKKETSCFDLFQICSTDDHLRRMMNLVRAVCPCSFAMNYLLFISSVDVAMHTAPLSNRAWMRERSSLAPSIKWTRMFSGKSAWSARWWSAWSSNNAPSRSELVKRIEVKRLSKSFGQLLYLASISQSEPNRQLCSIRSCGYQERNVFVLTNVPDLGETTPAVSEKTASVCLCCSSSLRRRRLDFVWLHHQWCGRSRLHHRSVDTFTRGTSQRVPVCLLCQCQCSPFVVGSCSMTSLWVKRDINSSTWSAWCVSMLEVWKYSFPTIIKRANGTSASMGKCWSRPTGTPCDGNVLILSCSPFSWSTPIPLAILWTSVNYLNKRWFKPNRATVSRSSMFSFRAPEKDPQCTALMCRIASSR